MPNWGYSTLFAVDKELTTAFKADCEELLDEFAKLNSFSFIEFSNIWKKKKFIYVFGGQRYCLLLKDYIENCFYTVKKFILFPKNLHIQIGALFILYGLYYKQPLRSWIKIRLTLEEYQKFLELVIDMRAKKHLDPVYIFSKLKAEKAFEYVAQRKPLGPEDRFIKGFQFFYDDTFTVSKVRNVEKKFVDLLSNSGLIQGLSDVDAKYQRLLKKYSEKCTDLVPMGSTLMSDLQDVNKKIIADNQLTESQERAASKTNLKKKAMTKKSALYRGSRAADLAALMECQSSESSSSKKFDKSLLSMFK